MAMLHIGSLGNWDEAANMDSQAPNAAAGQWLASGGLGEISGLRPETVHGDSRFDFSFHQGRTEEWIDLSVFLRMKYAAYEDGKFRFVE